MITNYLLISENNYSKNKKIDKVKSKQVANNIFISYTKTCDILFTKYISFPKEKEKQYNILEILISKQQTK